MEGGRERGREGKNKEKGGRAEGREGRKEQGNNGGRKQEREQEREGFFLIIKMCTCQNILEIPKTLIKNKII